MSPEFINMFLDRCVSATYGPQQMEYNKEVKLAVRQWIEDGGIWKIEGGKIPQQILDIIFLTAVKVFGRDNINTRLVRDIIREL